METKLRRLIIGTFVVTFLLIVGMIVGWNIAFIRPIKERKTAAENDFEAQQTAAQGLATAVRSARQAHDNLALVRNELDFVRQRYRILNVDVSTPEARELTWRGWMTEYAVGFGRAFRAELVNAADASRVTLNTTEAVVAPPQKPEDVAEPTSGFLKPLTGDGSVAVTVKGNLSDILDFLNRIEAGRILLTVGNIKLTGYAPDTTATFSVTPYLLANIPTQDLTGGAVTVTTAVAGAVSGAKAPAGAAGAAATGKAASGSDSTG